jgi:radical SAM superfamily enzyme YgiQ (UPF0313 family)
MRILLVSPKHAESFFGFSEVASDTGVPGYMPNLALSTLAAMVPDGIQLTTIDEEVEPVDFDTPWDLVGITGYISQSKRMFEIADEFRRRGRLVAIGGPYASLSPSKVRPHCDIMFLGEGEETWPQFLREFQQGLWQPEYKQVGNVDFGLSPHPKFEVMKPGGYWVAVVQTSRGCPFQCEFCDVIVYLGRKQRHKAPEQIVRELTTLYDAGYRSVFLSDDNFTANRKRAAEIMQAVGEWNRSQPEKTYFATQISIDVVRDPELLKLCADSGLKQAFVGIETNDEEALREVKKTQNMKRDLVRDVRMLQQHGIAVIGGLITGFDANTTKSFASLFEFAQAAGFPMTTVNMLHAPEGTPLEKRMLEAGRLKSEHSEVAAFDTNVLPEHMSSDELRAGTQWLLNKLYAPGPLLERLRVMAGDWPAVNETMVVSSSRTAQIWLNLMKSYAKLGPEYAKVPRQAVRMFHGKDTSVLMTCLIFALQAIGVMKKRRLYDPSLAERDEPNFASPPENFIASVANETGHGEPVADASVGV